MKGGGRACHRNRRFPVEIMHAVSIDVIGACESREAHSHKRPHELSPCLMLWGFNRVGFLKAGV